MTQGLDPLSGVPVYRQIAAAIRGEIESGRLGPGEQVPSENVLMEKYSAARPTVRQAVALLKAEGLVYAQRGRGAFVRDKAPVRRLAFDRFSRRHRKEGKAAYMVEMEARDPKVEVLHVGTEKASSEVAGWLNIHTGTQVVRRSRRYLDGAEPMELATSYIPWRLAKGTAIMEDNPGPGGIYARIEEQGHKLGRFTEEVHARMPTADEARVLSLPAGTPVFRLIRVALDTEGQPVEACDTVMASDRYVLNYELPAD